METDMSANMPVLPIAAGTLVRALASLLALLALLALVTHWLKALARARRHRRQAHVLARLDRRMLADIGITGADVRDAFSEPFWEDPTALLRERAIERRLNRTVTRVQPTPGIENGFRRLPIDQAARQAI
jgi:uncharacterized protein YjiS (DUF1127 family)